MAFGAVILVVASGLVGWAAAVDGDSSMSPAVRAAVAIGLIGGTLLTLLTAFRLGSNMGHYIGTEAPGAARMVLTGWSLTVGDLRPAHFFATHMMQAVPLAGIVAARVLPSPAAVGTVVVFAVLWTAVTLESFQAALAGKPITALLGR
jgi:hypothetical protein